MGTRGVTGTGESLERALRQACGDEPRRAPTPLESALREAADTPTDLSQSLRPRSRVPSPPPPPASIPRPRLDTLPYDDTVIGDDAEHRDKPLASPSDVGPSVRPIARSVPAAASSGRSWRANAAFMLMGAAIAAAGTALMVGPRPEKARLVLAATAPMTAMIVAADAQWRAGNVELARGRYRALATRLPASALPARVRQRASD
jgi:hypothetical protein